MDERYRRVRIATFNIRHGLGRDGVVDLEGTAAAVRATGARLVALQELDREKDRSLGVDQPQVLSELLGMPISFFPTVENGGAYGIALAGEALSGVSWHPLTRLGEEEPRGAIVGRWEELRAIATHLSRDRSARARQIEELARLAAEASGPVVVLGDLNTSRRALGPLEEIGLKPALASPDTGPFRSQIDHILVGGGVRLVDVWTIPTDASDHHPLVAELELPNVTGEGTVN